MRRTIPPFLAIGAVFVFGPALRADDKAKEIVKQAIAARGGEEKLSKVKGYRETSKGTISPQNNSATWCRSIWTSLAKDYDRAIAIPPRPHLPPAPRAALVVLGERQDSLERDARGGGVDEPAAGNHGGRLRQPCGIPKRLDFASRLKARTGPTVKTFIAGRIHEQRFHDFGHDSGPLMPD